MPTTQVLLGYDATHDELGLDVDRSVSWAPRALPIPTTVEFGGEVDEAEREGR